MTVRSLRHFSFTWIKGSTKLCKRTYNCPDIVHRPEGPPASDLEKDEGGWRLGGIGDLVSSFRPRPRDCLRGMDLVRIRIVHVLYML